LAQKLPKINSGEKDFIKLSASIYVYLWPSRVVQALPGLKQDLKAVHELTRIFANPKPIRVHWRKFAEKIIPRPRWL
jgi:hypothetical protein